MPAASVFARSKPPNRAARFEVRNSAIHGGGAFATCALAAGDRVGEYVGERINKAEAEVRCAAGNPFIFWSLFSGRKSQRGSSSSTSGSSTKRGNGEP